MGCFDYSCECCGATCQHIGGQHQDATVVIQVPLSDGTNVYLEGEYSLYGWVDVSMNNDIVRFYLEEFREYFGCWDVKRQLGYLAECAWTLREDPCDDDRYGDVVKGKVQRECYDGGPIIKLTPDILAKCVKA